MSRHAENLFARFQSAGDLEALGRVVDLVAPELLRTAMHLAPGPAEAEDLVQETLLTAMERAPSWDAGRPLRPWLVGILTNRARIARKQSARQPDPERLEHRAPPGPSEQAVELELTAELEVALREVPEAFRSVLVLRLKHHLSVPDIADALQRPPGTVRSQLQRGLEDLRRRLPASYAGAFSLFLGPLLGPPTRGLEAIKSGLLREAAATSVAVSVPSLVGVLAMKIAAATVLITLAAGVGYGLLGDGRTVDPIGPTGLGAAVARPMLEPAAMAEEPPRATLAVSAPVEHQDARPAPATAAGKGALVIQVLGEQSGAPASGYLVHLETFGVRSPFHDPKTAVTDAQGEARFEALDAGPAYARVLRGNEGGVKILAGEVSRLTLEAWNGVRVHGEVVDREGQPVPGATLWVSERWQGTAGYTVGNADANGHFTLDSLTSDHHLGAWAPGWASSLLQPVRGEAGSEFRVTLTLDRVGGPVEGRVFDPEGRPVGDALVRVGSRKAARIERLADGGQAFGPPLRRAHTDAGGAFRVDDVDTGRMPLSVYAEGFAPAELQVDVGAAPGPALTIVLTPESRVVGRVTDAAGKPLTAVEVRTDPIGAQGEGLTYTDLQGDFELRGLGAGPVRLIARHKSAGEATVERDLLPGEQQRWDPVLAPVLRFHGVVLDHQGTPLEGWTVAAHPTGRNEVRLRSYPTDAAGRFVIREVTRAPHKLWVQEPGGWRRFPRLVLRDVRPGEALELRLEDPRLTRGTLVGEVVGPDGAAPGAVQLAFWHEELSLWREYPLDSTTGAIQIEGLPPGNCTLELRGQEHPWLEVGSVEILAGREVDLGRHVLPRGGVVVGKLMGAEEQALDSLRFLLIGETGREAGTVQRTGRSFRSNPLTPGAYVIEVRGDHVAPLRQDLVVVAGEETPCDLRLEPAPLRRVVFECVGDPPQRLWCEVRDGTGARVWMNGNLRRLEDGQFVARISLPKGVYRLSAGDGAGRALEAGFVMAGTSEDEPLRLSLEAR